MKYNDGLQDENTHLSHAIRIKNKYYSFADLIICCKITRL